MSETTIQEEHSAQVISLREFRQQLREAEAQPPGYGDVDHLTYHQVKGMVEDMHGRASPGLLVVLSREVTDEPSKVIVGRDRKTWLYGVTINKDQHNELTEDLSVLDKTDEEKLRKPLERLLLTSLIAEYTLRRENYELPVSGVPNPKVGQPGLKVRYQDNKERYLNITRWRAASGTGLIAITGSRPDIQSDVRNYLSFTIGRRFQTLRSRTKGRALVGMANGENVALNDTFIGLCNPLDRSQLTRIKSPESGNKHLSLV